MLGRTSLQRLASCDERLQDIAYALDKEFEFTVCAGFRGEQEQNLYFSIGKSKVKFPLSKHNVFPSLAMDIAPYDVKNKQLDFSPDRMADMLARVERIAQEKNISIRLGRDFKDFHDDDHVEILS